MPTTSLDRVAEKTRAAIAAQRAATEGTAATPPVATTPPPAAAAKELKLTKLVQIMLEGTPLHRPVAEAAAKAQLSPASWVAQIVAKELNIALPPPEKKIVDPVEKARAKADEALLELVLVEHHYSKIVTAAPVMQPMLTKATAKIASYVKKLAETLKDQSKADAILAATRVKVAETLGA